MKKITLNLSNTKGTEILSREQLKKILGGDPGSGNTWCTYHYSGSGYSVSGPMADTLVPGFSSWQQFATYMCANTPGCGYATCG